MGATMEGIGVEMNNGDRITLSSLSALTGFPVDFIKKELVVDADDVSIDELRKSVMTFLNSTMDLSQDV